MNEVVFYPGQPEDVRVGLGITVILRDNKGNWRVRSLTWRDEKPAATHHDIDEVISLWEKDHGELRYRVNMAGNTLADRKGLPL